MYFQSCLMASEIQKLENEMFLSSLTKFFFSRNGVIQVGTCVILCGKKGGYLRSNSVCEIDPFHKWLSIEVLTAGHGSYFANFAQIGYTFRAQFSRSRLSVWRFL